MSVLGRARSSKAGGSEFDPDESQILMSLAGDGEEAGDCEKAMCFGCGEEDTLDNLPDNQGDKYFHHRCLLGVRSYNRTFAGNPKAQTANRHMMLHNTDAWREKVRPFIFSANRSFAIADQRRVLQETESHEAVQAQEAIGDTMVLTESQFIGWVGIYEQTQATLL